MATLGTKALLLLGKKGRELQRGVDHDQAEIDCLPPLDSHPIPLWLRTE